MRPILVAGTTGQLARSLVDVGQQRAIPIVAVSRPKLDLENADSIERVVKAVLPRAIVNAAAYTAVDMVAPDSQATACPPSGRNSTYRPVQISETSSDGACWTGHFARFHTISSVTPAGVRGFVNFISSTVMDVMIRR